MTAAQIATAPVPATIRTLWRSGSRSETVAIRKRSSPFSSTNATGRTVFTCQFTRTEGVPEIDPAGDPFISVSLCVLCGLRSSNAQSKPLTSEEHRGATEGLRLERSLSVVYHRGHAGECSRE